MKNISVIGAGTMGHGIAEAFAIHGYQVKLFDISSDMLKSAILSINKELQFLANEGVIEKKYIKLIESRITTFDDLELAVKDADYVIESIVENLKIKQKLFFDLDKFCKPDAILSSNTSSLCLSDMIEGVNESRKKNCIITHFYNPSNIMPIVEVTYFGDTSEDTYLAVEAMYKSIKKQVVKVLKEVPGLIANRIQQAVAREVFSLIELGVGTPKDIDNALKFGPAFRYCSTGQLEIADFGGIDIWKIVGDNLLPEMDNSTAANPLLTEKVNDGKLGVKSLEGFYKYNAETIDEVKTQYMKKLIIQLKTSENYI
ncbi:MAG: 3-hydroxyacyl-CoA dehydrogenase family protein [Vibrio sp.]|uniref:3-hydroxyacyl-CoA dehydrogenase family protein n=1 Tax=Vibrio sp. TaxID=678 RepID=UPI003A898F3B